MGGLEKATLRTSSGVNADPGPTTIGIRRRTLGNGIVNVNTPVGIVTRWFSLPDDITFLDTSANYRLTGNIEGPDNSP